MNDDSLYLSTDKHRLDVGLIHAFLHDHAPWAKGIARATVEQAIAGSICFGAYLDGRQVGFARVVTDQATFGYLCDVFVVPECRGCGYARLLMQKVAQEPALARLRRIVLVTSNAHGVYQPFGFTALEHPERYMELHRPDIYSRGE
ncbi:GNAT family N-acetyltransferase [Chromobacterium sphagni]|uniref:GNAT family N-acetyltransferase n=1 Tax=Chromobacterium sphagni TaxID=1903179 RepID=A0A1S1X2E9_9NEIS|nr:GNAT family N-acetyltransferase [Chromobacterium sphagni]OHX13356.1 GNAT family N-acetyltransferase [Chromobacterium sphagni]